MTSAETVQVDAGACIAFGGSNARLAYCEDGDIAGFRSVETPKDPAAFFAWMARGVLDVSQQGNQWLVAGFPGPVSPDGRMVGPMPNVGGMSEGEYDLAAELNRADPEVGRIVEQGFKLLVVNDGTLAAQAVASRIGEDNYYKSGALIIGTGVGAGVTIKDQAYTNVHRADKSSPLEIGHLMLSLDPEDTYENRYSGPALKKQTGLDAREIPANHPIWIDEGAAVGQMACYLGLMHGVELVVPTGGVGIGASDKFKSVLSGLLNAIKMVGNGPQRKFLPEVKLVPPSECNVFEIYGAEGVIRDHLTTS